MKNFKTIIFGFTITFLALNLTSCSQDMLPVSPSENSSKSANLEFLSFGKTSQSLQKIINDSKYIKRKKGGTLHIEYCAGKLKIDVKLKIHRKSIQVDTEFLMSIDSDQFVANLDVVFGPHGTQFSKFADLDIKVEGLDLSGFDFDSNMDVYYDNEESGQWEKMETDRIKVDYKKGKIEVKKAKLPHFSRYALAWSR